MCLVCATDPRKSSDNRRHQDHDFPQLLLRARSKTLPDPDFRPWIIRVLCALTGQAPVRCPAHSNMEVSMAGPFKLASLPWQEAALEPVISSRTISFHYHKHHQTYVDTLNKLIEKTKFADMKLEQIIQATANSEDEKEKKIFNNAAQVWNHDFYWRSLSPNKTEPTGKLASAIARDFGSTSDLI